MNIRWVARYLFHLLFLLYVSVILPAIDTAEINPHLLQPELLGRGGAFTGHDHGYLAALTNPARLAVIPGEATYFSSTSWLHSNIDSLIPAFLSLLSGQATDSTRPALDTVLSNNGLGFGTALGGGYYGDGLGIGVNVASDIFFFGRSFPNEIFGSITTDIRATFALAYSFELDPVLLSLGVAFEPFYRIHTSFSERENARLIEQYFKIDTTNSINFLTSQNTLYGSGAAFHAGLLLEILQQFTVSVILRDIGDTRIEYSRTSLQNLIHQLNRLALPKAAPRGTEGHIDSGQYIFPTDLRVGLAYHPEWEVGVVLAPLFVIEVGELDLLLKRPVGFNILHALHLGAQMNIDDEIFLQVGLNQGQLTFGTGFDSGIFEIHGAWFGRVINDPQEYLTSHGLLIHFQFRN